MTETTLRPTPAARSPRAGPAAAVIAFAAFGAFWGVWGASVPRVQDQAGVSDGELGLALLFVGAGALPPMLLVGCGWPGASRWRRSRPSAAVSTAGVCSSPPA